MIIDFSVENFRSIKDMQEFSMSAAPGRENRDQVFAGGKEKLPILKTGLIYGANASGKSNLILALSEFCEFILTSTDLKLGHPIPYYQPFKFDRSAYGSATQFEMEFIAKDQIRYRYLVAFNGEHILKEELVYFPKKQEVRLFLREKGQEMRFGDSLRGKKRSIESELLDNNLFLSKAANSRHEQLSAIYLYFFDMKIIQNHGGPNEIQTGLISARLMDPEGSQYKELVTSFLKTADLGVQGFRVKKTDSEFKFSSSMPEHLKAMVQTAKGFELTLTHELYDKGELIGSMDLEIEEESAGTRKLYELSLLVIDTLLNGGVLVMDELNNCLHPLISEFILDLFRDPEKNPKNGQLIAATHDTTLLDSSKLRRDQIWFTEKDGFGATHLFSLAEFNSEEVRKSSPFQKWYLTGRFGALPMISKGDLMVGGSHAKEA